MIPPFLLGRTVGRVNQSGTAPPWSLEVWNPETRVWESVAAAQDQLIFDRAGTVLVDTACHPILTRS